MNNIVRKFWVFEVIGRTDHRLCSIEIPASKFTGNLCDGTYDKTKYEACMAAFEKKYPASYMKDVRKNEIFFVEV